MESRSRLYDEEGPRGEHSKKRRCLLLLFCLILLLPVIFVGTLLYHVYSFEPFSVTLVLRPGENEVSIDLPQGRYMLVIVEKTPCSGTNFTVKGEVRCDEERLCAIDGRVVTSPKTPGECEVWAHFEIKDRRKMVTVKVSYEVERQGRSPVLLEVFKPMK